MIAEMLSHFVRKKGQSQENHFRQRVIPAPIDSGVCNFFTMIKRFLRERLSVGWLPRRFTILKNMYKLGHNTSNH